MSYIMYICQNAKFLSAKKKLFLKDEVKNMFSLLFTTICGVGLICVSLKK